MKNILLPTAYLAPILYYCYLANYHAIIFEQQEHYIKQSYRNRCSIYAANGKMELSIPVHKIANRTLIKDVRIANEQNWQKLHWRSIASAYGSSPFYLYYNYELLPFYEKKFEFLWDFNESLQNKMLELIKVSISPVYTTFYLSEPPGVIDLRSSLHPKKNDLPFPTLPSYQQVFQNKYGFFPNLSIIDLLFNLGPRCNDYLRTLKPY